MEIPIDWGTIPVLDKKTIINKILRHYLIYHDSPIFLDIGGAKGKWWMDNDVIDDYTRIVLDIRFRRKATNYINGDACKLPIKDNSLDVVFSNNTLEHIKEPWIAAEEFVRVLKSGGLLIHTAPMSWKYHGKPIDYYRYTHKGLAYLFERTGKVIGIESGYDDKYYKNRKTIRRRGKLDENMWTEFWTTVYIGRKK